MGIGCLCMLAGCELPNNCHDSYPQPGPGPKKIYKTKSERATEDERNIKGYSSRIPTGVV